MFVASKAQFEKCLHEQWSFMCINIVSGHIGQHMLQWSDWIVFFSVACRQTLTYGF